VRHASAARTSLPEDQIFLSAFTGQSGLAPIHSQAACHPNDYLNLICGELLDMTK
jgi:hypothetical protein